MASLNLDIRTTLMLLVLGNLVVGATLLAYGRRPNSGRPVARYIAGAFLQALAWTLLALRGVIPDFWSVQFANPMLLLGFALENLGLSVARSPSRRPDRLFVALAAAGILLFLLGPQTPNLRIVTVSTASLLTFLALAVFMLDRRERSALTVLVGSMTVLFCLFLGYRIAWAASGGASSTLMTPALSQTLIFSAHFVFTFLNAIGLILILNERADRRLLESEEKYRTLVERASEAIVIAQDGRFVFANQRMGELVGVDPARVVGAPFEDYVWPGDAAMVRDRHFRRLSGSEQPEAYDFRLKGADEKPVWVSLSTAIISWGGRPATLNLLTDIDSRKHSEDRISALLAEKELLLREVHHRVKNNLAVAMGLLSLQAGAASAGGTGRDPESILLDASGRLQVLAELYDLLHTSKNFAAMPMRDFLGPLLERIAAVFPRTPPVRVELEGGAFELDTGRLATLGIMVNELATNSMKHAYEGIPDPLFRLSATEEGGRVRVTCVDNGKGLPEGFDPAASEGLGMQLVSMLASQLRAGLRIEGRGGTSVELVFDAARAV